MHSSKGDHVSVESTGSLRRGSFLISEDLCSYKGQAEEEPNQKWGQKKASQEKQKAKTKKQEWDCDSGKNLQRRHLKLNSEWKD